MDSMRESWTDERLDDLNHKVDAGFDRIDRRFERIDQRFDRIDERFERMNDRFDALHRLLVQSAGVLLAALVGLHFV